MGNTRGRVSSAAMPSSTASLLQRLPPEQSTEKERAATIPAAVLHSLCSRALGHNLDDIHMGYAQTHLECCCAVAMYLLKHTILQACTAIVAQLAASTNV